MGKYTEITNQELQAVEILSSDTDEDLAEVAESIFLQVKEKIIKDYDTHYKGTLKQKMANYDVITAHAFDKDTKQQAIDILVRRFREIRNARKIEAEQVKDSDSDEDDIVISETISINLHELRVTRELLNELKDAKNLEGEERKDKLSDLFELDQTNVLVLSGSQNKTEGKVYPKFALDRVIKNYKDEYKVIKTEEGDSYILSQRAMRSLQNEISRPFQDWYIERREEAAKRRAERLEQKVQEEDRLLADPWIQNYMLKHPGKKVDEYLSEVRKHLKEQAYKALQKNKVKMQKIAREMRDVIRREVQRENRAHYRELQFSTNMNDGVVESIDKMVDKAITEVRSKLNAVQTMYKKQPRIAVIGTSQRLIDSEHIHKPGENTWFDSYSQQRRVVYDKNGRVKRRKDGTLVTKETKGFVRQANSVPKSYVENWYKSTLNLTVNLIPEWEEEDFIIQGVLKPAYVTQNKATWNQKVRDQEGKTQSVKHEVDYGCLLAATYFYTLVSNTPIDEPYLLQANGDLSTGKRASQGEKYNYWERARLAVKKRNNHTKADDNKTVSEIYNELIQNKPKIKATYYRTRMHHPDNESVRGDWILEFRGVTFKAFKSTPASNSESVSPQYYFSEEDFINPVTSTEISSLSNVLNDNGKIKNTNFKPYIWKIAEQIASVVPAYEDDIKFYVHNINPRWQILEYGGYQSDKNGPWKGSGKYGLLHGVNDNGFSYQAPTGFKRIVDAQYNAIMTRSALYNKSKGKAEVGTATAYTRANRSLDWNFDISKMDQAQYKKLMALFANEDHTLTIENIHTIDGTKVWKWEKVR